MFRIILPLIVCVLAISCDNERDAKPATITMEETDTLQNSFIHDLGTVRKNIEQAAVLYEGLYRGECPFNASLIPGELNGINQSRSQAIAFGRYGSYFVYAASYEQRQIADKLLANVLDLSDGMGIREVFNEEQLRLLNSSDPEIDKSAVLTKTYLKATEQMYSEERAVLVSYMVLGGWVQGMKLSYEICGDFLANQDVGLGLYDQTYSYYNCIRLLKNFEHIKECAQLLEDLQAIEPLIDEMVKSRGKISNDLFIRLRAAVTTLDEKISQ